MITPEGCIFICFAIILIVVGSWPTKSDLKQGCDLLLPGRNLSAFESGSSIAASKIGSGLIITYSIFAMQYGWWALTFFVGYSVGYFFYYLLAKSISQDEKCNDAQSLKDYVAIKTGSQLLAKTTATLVSLTMIAWILTNLIGGAKLLTATTSWSHEFSTIILSSTILFYLLCGGFKAVVRTDVVQIFALLGLFALAVVALSSNQVTNQPPSTSSMPIVLVFSFFLVGGLFPFGSAEVFERFSRLKSNERPLSAVITSASIYIAVGILLTILCSYSRPFIGAFPDKEMTLAVGIKNALAPISPLLPSLWILAFIAAIMSSADTYIYSATRSIVHDFKETKPSPTKGRVALCVVTICSTLVALLLKQINYIIPLFLGITLILSTIVLFCWRWNGSSAITLFVTSLISLAICAYLWTIATFITPQNLDSLIIISGALFNFIAFYGISKLRNFYKKLQSH